MEHLKSFPTILILHWFLCNLHRLHLIRIKSGSDRYSRENITLWTSSAGLLFSFFVYILCFSVLLMYITKKKKKAFESDCLRLFLPTWKLVQIRGKFPLQAEGMLHEQINTKSGTSRKPALSSYGTGCWLLWSSHWSVDYNRNNIINANHGNVSLLTDGWM